MLPDFRPEQLDRIGFSHVMENCLPHSPFGCEERRAISPFPQSAHEQLQRELEAVGTLVKICREANGVWIEDVHLILSRFKEIRGTVRKLTDRDHVLDEIDLFELKGFAINLGDLVKLPHVTTSVALLGPTPQPLGDLVALLNPEPIGTRSFSLADAYCPELARIRREKQAVERQMFSGEGGCDQEALKEERRRLVALERKAEEGVRRQLTERIRPWAERLSLGRQFVGRFDFLLAKARLAIDLNATAPRVNRDGQCLVMEDAKNPLVAAQLATDGKPFTPISLTLQRGAGVITGANMGGKSVVLATITLNSLLALCGFFVCARKMELPHLDFVFYLTDDMPSMQPGLSTFGAEVTQVARLLKLMREGRRGLAALDEFARGTNPEEGEALLRALLEYVSRFDSFLLASTHYSRVVGKGMAHYQVIGLRQTGVEKLKGCLNGHPPNPSAPFGGLQECMDYRLARVDWDSPPPREAVRVAELLGLDEELLAMARARLETSPQLDMVAQGPIEEAKSGGGGKIEDEAVEGRDNKGNRRKRGRGKG